MGLVMTVGIAALGIALSALGIRWLVKSEGKGMKVVGVICGVVGLALVGGGVWYGVVGSKYSEVEKAKHRTAGSDVRVLVKRFEKLLTKCRAEVFPAMPYEASEAAKKDNYKKAIKVLSSELLLCYTGSKGMGQEKSAELDQIKWLVEKGSCAVFTKRLTKERTFCPQMIESLIGKAGFKDTLADIDENKPRQATKPAVDLTADLEKLKPSLIKCHKEMLKGYVPPKGSDPKEAAKKAVGAMIKAWIGCSKGEGDDEFSKDHLEKLSKAKGCAALGEAFRGLGVCTVAMEAPTKVGYTFGTKTKQ